MVAAAMADVFWLLLAAPGEWRRFWLRFTRVLGRPGRLRWAMAAVQTAIGLAMLRSGRTFRGR
jgi:hypothetical protein